MLKKEYMIIVFLAFCLTATLFVGLTSTGEVEAQVTPVVYLDPPSVTSNVCQNFTVDIRIRDLEAALHFSGWEVKLGYHNIILEALDGEEGPFMPDFADRHGTYFIFLQESGYVHLAGLFLNSSDGDHDGTPGEEEDWPYGTGVLATVTFHCMKVGQCVLDLYDTRLVAGMNYIPHQVEDGYFGAPSPAIVDLNNDGIVNIIDIVTVGLAFGAQRIDDPEDPRYGEYWHDPPCPNCPH